MAEMSLPKVFNVSNNESIDCAICLQQCVHPTVLPCGHVFCYLCIKGLGRTTRMCAMCRQEFSADLLENPTLLRPIDPSFEQGFEDGHQWFYEGRNGGWWQYEIRTSEEIETAFKAGDKMTEVVICGELYIIDFSTNHQFQKNNPIRKRRIKRSSVKDTQKKGIAGIK